MPKDRLDIMFDLETLGNDRSKGLAFSVAYAPFTLSAVEGEPWNAPVRGIRANQIYIEVNSSVEYGRRWDQTTIEWWKTQSNYGEVVKEYCENAIPFKKAWTLFYNEIKSIAEEYHIHVWSRGTDFDFPIIQSSLRDAGFNDTPWKFWDQLDVRTFVNMVETLGMFKAAPRKKEFPKHNALGDCYQQIYDVQTAFAYLAECQAARIMIYDDLLSKK